MIPLLFVVARADWAGFRVNEAELSFQMPSKPDRRQSLFQNVPAVFFTSDSVEGHFVAGYTLFPNQARAAVHQQIVANPGSEGIRSLISMTVKEFAKPGNAKILSPEFGLDKGLPTEFATLDNGKMKLNIRVYLGSIGTYVFVTRSSSEAAQRYFDSVKLTAEVKR